MKHTYTPDYVFLREFVNLGTDYIIDFLSKLSDRLLKSRTNLWQQDKAKQNAKLKK